MGQYFDSCYLLSILCGIMWKFYCLYLYYDCVKINVFYSSKYV